MSVRTITIPTHTHVQTDTAAMKRRPENTILHEFTLTNLVEMTTYKPRLRSATSLVDLIITTVGSNSYIDILNTTTEDYTDATQKYVGKSAIPDVRGGFRLSAEYKNFDISAQQCFLQSVSR
mgnify:CR=1 FL=1